MQKAFKWLDANKVKYTFHNYKEEGISKEKITAWLKEVPLTELINSRGTTFRNLSDSDKIAVQDVKKAIPIIIANTSMIKRPLMETPKGILLGFKEEEWKKKLES